MIKTIEELKKQAKDKDIKLYPVHKCSMCNYQCGFIIDKTEENEGVYYDSGCYCTGRSCIEPRSWNELADTYNMNQPENNKNVGKKFLDELDETWNFNK